MQIRLASVMVDNQENALRFYTSIVKDAGRIVGRVGADGRKVGHSFSKELVALYQRVIAKPTNKSYGTTRRKEVSKTISASGNDTSAPAFGRCERMVRVADIVRQEITREQFKKN
jgi:prolyl-tRNA synthetase